MSAVMGTYYFGAAVDGSGDEYKIVKREDNADGKAVVALSAAGDEDGFGVVQDIGLGSAGQSAAVCVAGLCKVKLGATFTPGTDTPLFKSDANGLAVPCDTDLDPAIGYLLMDEAVTYASGDIVNAIVARSTYGK